MLPSLAYIFGHLSDSSYSQFLIYGGFRKKGEMHHLVEFAG